MQKISHSYFVVMEDLGRRGMEAVVTPETTRGAVVQFIKNGNYRNIVFIHHIDGLYIEDVTAELIDEAEVLAKEQHVSARMNELASIDHARDHRKHGAV